MQPSQTRSSSLRDLLVARDDLKAQKTTRNEGGNRVEEQGLTTLDQMYEEINLKKCQVEVLERQA
jgi:hypothetical protein